MPYLAFVIAIAGFAATVAVIPVLLRYCAGWGLVDQPDHRKHHEGAIPLCGGLAMMFGLAVVTALFGDDLPSGHERLSAALSLLLVVGLLDDRFELSVRVRVLVQCVAVLLVAYGDGISIASVGDLTGSGSLLLLRSWAPLLTVIGMVGVVNAMNMVDGLDGLAGGMAFIAFAWFAWVAFMSGLHSHAALAMAFAGIVAGFLLFNMRRPGRSRAAIFMGDAGSTVLGFALAWFAVTLTQGQGRTFPPMAAVWVLGLPLLDTLSLMLRRVLKRRSPMAPDREHLHHVLLRAGYSHESVVLLMLSISALFGAVAVAAWQLGVSESVLFAGALSIYAVYLLSGWKAWRLMTWLKERRGAVSMPSSHERVR